MTGVLACGVAVLDVQQTVDRIPRPDEKLAADELLVASGGPAANAAVTAASLGASARLVTRIGTSALGTLIAADLAGHAVEVIDCAGPLYQPAVSTVLVTRGTGQRAVVSVNATAHPGDASPAGSGSAGSGSSWSSSEDWAQALVAGVDAVLVDGHHLDLAIPLARAARTRGVPVLLDGGSWKPGLEGLLAVVDVAVVSEVLLLPAALAWPAGDVLEGIRALGPAMVARSRGPLPIEALTDQGRWEVGVPSVAVVDTLGAGDVLHGALLAWIAHHGMGQLPAGLAWAARVAADSCTGAGARGWLADRPRLAGHRSLLAQPPGTTVRDPAPRG